MHKFKFLNLLLLLKCCGAVLYPNIRQPVQAYESLPPISKEDIESAFSYAEDQHNMRMEMENNYIKSGGELSDTILSAEARGFFQTTDRAMEQHRVDEQLEDATKYLVKKYNLTKTQTISLQGISLNEDHPLIQKCIKYRTVDTCNSTTKYRTLDGGCNNLENQNWGRAYTAGTRMAVADYGDGIVSIRESKCGDKLPNARLISITISPDVDVPARNFTALLLSVGQLLAHDMTHVNPGRAGDKNNLFKCCPMDSSVPLPSFCLPLEVPPKDMLYTSNNQTCIPFARTVSTSSNCRLGSPRLPLQHQSGFIDGSIFYGVTKEESDQLRVHQGGLLRVQSTADGDLLPESAEPRTDQCSATLSHDRKCFRTADFRAHVQPGLVGLHTLVVRQHNRIARIFSAEYPEKTDEEIFLETRRIISTKWLVFAYKEFLPVIIGPELMTFFKLNVLEDGYTEYDPTVDPTTPVEVSTAAFRFGHSTFPSVYTQVDPQGVIQEKMDLTTHQFGVFQDAFYDGKLDAIFRGLFSQPGQEFDRFYVNALSDHCVQSPKEKYGLDVSVLEIQRGRDHGLPSYTDMLNYCFNVTIKSFDDLKVTMTESDIENLKTVHKCVDDIDLSTGAVLEKHIEGGIVGPTYGCIMGKHFQNLKFGDRFYFEHGKQAGSFTEGQLKEIRKVTLARFICESSDRMNNITANPLRPTSQENPVVNCVDLPEVNFTKWFDK